MTHPASTDPMFRDRYLDLLEAALTRSGPYAHRLVRGKGLQRVLLGGIQRVLAAKELVIAKKSVPFHREHGLDVPLDAETMVGLKRLRDIRWCIRTIIDDDVEGDLLEAGVWRGGTCIFMRAVLEAFDEPLRSVWVADSFQGMPHTDVQTYPQDRDDKIGRWAPVAVGLEEVRANFQRYGLLDDRVKFVPGWFHETLAAAPIQSLAILRLDCDLYGSTITVLDALYDRVSRGGFVVVDDYGLSTCRAAIDDFRRDRRIEDPIIDIDGAAVRWRVS